MSVQSNKEFFNHIKNGDVEKVKECLSRGERVPYRIDEHKPNGNISALEYSAQLPTNEIFYLLYKKIRQRYQEKVDTFVNALLHNNYEVAEVILNTVPDLLWKIPFKSAVGALEDKIHIEGFLLLQKYGYLNSLSKYEVKEDYILKAVSSAMNAPATKFILTTVSAKTLQQYMVDLSIAYNSQLQKATNKENVMNILTPILIEHIGSLSEKDFNILEEVEIQGPSLYEDIMKEVSAIKLYGKLKEKKYEEKIIKPVKL